MSLSSSSSCVRAKPYGYQADASVREFSVPVPRALPQKLRFGFMGKFGFLFITAYNGSTLRVIDPKTHRYFAKMKTTLLRINDHSCAHRVSLIVSLHKMPKLHDMPLFLFVATPFQGSIHVGK